MKPNKCIYCDNNVTKIKHAEEGPNIYYVQCNKCKKVMSAIKEEKETQEEIKGLNAWQYFLLFGGMTK